MSVDVLVVDDDDDIRDTLAILVELHGATVAGARDGREALALLRGGVRPRLLLLDLMMPGMSGEELLEAMQREGALDGVRVVILSGDTRAREHASAYGAVDCLAKPIELDDLLALLDRYVRPPPAQPAV